MRTRTSQIYDEDKIAHASEKVISGDLQTFFKTYFERLLLQLFLHLC